MSTTYDCRAELEPGVSEAADALQRGLLAVIPTDTVYGVAADAFDPAAVARLLEAKGRGRDMPTPVLVAGPQALEGLCDTVPQEARDLVAAFWPGALTVVLRHAATLAWDLGDTKGTVAVRMPDHPVALAVLERTGPLAVSSANRSGMPPAADAAEAARQLGRAVEVYLDGGESGEAVPSTIVDLTGATPTVLRLGALSLEELRGVVPGIEAPG